MKNFVRPWPVVVALLSPAIIPGAARAAVVWTATFEKNKSGDVCASGAAGAEFVPGAIVVNNGRIDAEVVGEQVYSGSLACKVTVHPDDIFGQYKQDRVDLRHNSTLTGEGKDMYLSGYYYLPEDAKTRNEFGMFETTNSLNWMDIWVEPKTGGGTTIKLGIESNGANLGSVPVWSGDFTTAQWHQIAIHVHWSQDAAKGLVDFWLDGKQVVTGFKHKTKPNQYDLYFLTGLHRVLMQPSTESIYFDDFIEADAQADIKIGVPMSSGGKNDGGAGTNDAAGSTDAVGTGGVPGTAGMSGSAGTGGTGGADQSTGAAGTTGSAGSGAMGTAGTGSIGAAGNPSAGTGEGGTSSAGTTGTGGTRAKSSGGCMIAQSPPTGLCPGLALAGILALGFRRRRR
jgi:MYXO-CTERM domain-containing protein